MILYAYFFPPQNKLIFIILELTVLFFSFTAQEFGFFGGFYSFGTIVTMHQETICRKRKCLRVAIEKSWNQMKTKWWICDIWKALCDGRKATGAVSEANAAAYFGFNEKRLAGNGNAESFYGKIVKSNINKLGDFRHLEPLCDGRKAAGVRGQCRGLRRLRLCSTRTPCSSKL